MKKNTIIGLALVAAAVGFACIVPTSVGAVATRLVGKAVWYLPYAALCGAVRFFARG